MTRPSPVQRNPWFELSKLLPTSSLTMLSFWCTDCDVGGVSSVCWYCGRDLRRIGSMD